MSHPKPQDARTDGQSRLHPVRADWNAIREQVMWLALWFKFAQRRKIGLPPDDKKVLLRWAENEYGF